MIPPWGVHSFTAKRESRRRQSGLPYRKAVPWRGEKADLRAADGGKRRGGGLGGRDFSNGAWRRHTVGRKRGEKPLTRASSGTRDCAHAELPGGKRGLFMGRAGRKVGNARAKRGIRAHFGAFMAGVWGKKTPFCREKGGKLDCAGAKTVGVIGGACRVIGTCVQESSGGFGGKAGASKKPFHAHIGRNCLSPLFFVDGAPSVGTILWWFGRVAFPPEKSDECVTPSGAGKPTPESEKEATP